MRLIEIGKGRRPQREKKKKGVVLKERKKHKRMKEMKGRMRKRKKRAEKRERKTIMP